MKRKNKQNLNGITISDSIVMSVKKKHMNFRKPFSAAIAIIGYISIIMAYLNMFRFHYNHTKVMAAVLFFGAFYLTLSLIAKRALWVYCGSIVIFFLAAIKRSSKIAMGFRFMYNIIYKASYHSKIEYYRDIKPALEVQSVTTLFCFYIWMLAIILFFFTICRPNPVLPLMATFPVLEIGMYNGIKVPVFWGVLCIAYWLALLAMSTIDVGEYSGGQSGFVRKNDLFFPKRHMKLKVTERCGMFVIASVVGIAAVSGIMMKVTNYERSERLDKKRREITEALNDFSFENFAESLANLTSAIGLDFEYENHKLGDNDHVRYKNVTDLTVTLNHSVTGAIYLKDYSGAIYKKNEWFDLPASKYKNDIFSDYDKYGIHPQDFPYYFQNLLGKYGAESVMMTVKPSAKKSKHVYAPYGARPNDSMKYDRDLTISKPPKPTKEPKYDFIHMDTEALTNKLIEIEDTYKGKSVREVYSASEIDDKEWRDKILEYCSDHDLLSYDDMFPVDFDIPADKNYLLYYSDTLMAELMEGSYRDFVYANYLDVPDTDAMNEVRNSYSDIISANDGSIAGKIEVLNKIRERMATECSYSLYPRKTPSNRDFVNYFLLENKKGYCTHYATAGVMLARMAGIPARYATGYVIVEKDLYSRGKHNPDGSWSLDVKDNRSHAWAEIYLDSVGWIPFEFTAGYSSYDINTDPTETTTAERTTADPSKTTTSSATSSVTTMTRASTSSITSTSTVQQTNTVTTDKNGKWGFGNGLVSHIPKAVKNILLFIFAVLAIIGAVLLRRYLTLKIREKKFTTGKAERRIRSMYTYAEKLLETKNMRSSHGNFKQFAAEVEKGYSSAYFTEGGFENLTDIALRVCFGNYTPEKEEISACRKTVDELSSNIYAKADKFTKFKFKFINVLK